MKRLMRSIMFESRLGSAAGSAFTVDVVVVVIVAVGAGFCWVATQEAVVAG
jgi:hypothetical protein